jgi:transposase
VTYIVVRDNLPAHKVASLTKLVEARGALLLYLLPYLYDFNPIELAFSVLETWLHMAQVRTSETLGAFIQTATDRITDHDAKNWFDHYGYHVH